MTKQSDLSQTAMIPHLVQLNGLPWRDEQEHPWRQWVDLALTMPQFKLLLVIASGNGFRVGDLAQRLGVTPPTVTTILDRLVQHGLVRREDHPVDRRLVIARLTAEGARLLQRLRVYAHDEIFECLADLTPDDLHSLQVGLEALQRAWQARQAMLAASNEPDAC